MAGRFYSVPLDQLLTNAFAIVASIRAELEGVGKAHGVSALLSATRPRHDLFAIGLALNGLFAMSACATLLGAAAKALLLPLGWFATNVVAPAASGVLDAAAKPTRKPFLYLSTIGSLILTALKGIADRLSSSLR